MHHIYEKFMCSNFLPLLSAVDSLEAASAVQTLYCSVQTLYRLCIDSVQTLCRLRNTLCRLCVDPLTPNGQCRLFVALNYSFQTLYRPKIALCRICVDLYCPAQTLSRPKLALIWFLCRLCRSLLLSVYFMQILNCSLQTLSRSLFLCIDFVQTQNHSVQTLCRPRIDLCRP